MRTNALPIDNAVSKSLVHIDFRYRQQNAVISTVHSLIMRRGILSALTEDIRVAHLITRTGFLTLFVKRDRSK